MSENLGAQTSQFKFRWVGENGNESGFFAKRGHYDGQTLVLEDTEIPIAAIASIETRDRFMALNIYTGEGEPAGVVISVTGIGAGQLKSSIDIARSAVWAEHHRQDLEQKGRLHEYRVEQCPHCTATLILSDMPKTAQTYCHFCDTLSTTENPHQAPPQEHQFKLCDECGMYSQPRKYTIFYFYFLLVVYGFSSRPTWRCPACMRGEAWKMLFGNMLFVLGLPVAIVQLIRSYGGSISGPFAGLDDANIRAGRGDVTGALKRYQAILERVPCSAGVKFNLGLGLLQQNDIDRAAQTFELSLDDCGNYAPAYNALTHCYEQLGETQKLAALKRQWDDCEEEQQQADTPEN